MQVRGAAGANPVRQREGRCRVFYGWQKKLFEEGAVVFEQGRAKSGRQEAAEQRRIAFLEAKLRNKDEVMAELLGEHVALKKVLGRSEGRLGPP